MNSKVPRNGKISLDEENYLICNENCEFFVGLFVKKQKIFPHKLYKKTALFYKLACKITIYKELFSGVTLTFVFKANRNSILKNPFKGTQNGF